MENKNYIDSLQVSLIFPSSHAPGKARDEADDLVDTSVVPAVEAVMEKLGRDIDASIPQLEIDVGRVRRQDLRDVVEAALRNALERYRTSPGPSMAAAGVSGLSAPSLAEGLRTYVETGIPPGMDTGAPFRPARFLQEILGKTPEAYLDSLGAFSEKELTGLLMLTHSASSAKERKALLPIREAILNRLSREYPETAAVLTARLDVWRRYGEILVSHPAKGKAGIVSSPENTDSRNVNPGPVRRRFSYVEVGPEDIPENAQVVSGENTDTPDGEDSEFIVSPGPLRRYFRKVAADSLAHSSGDLEEKPASAGDNAGETLDTDAITTKDILREIAEEGAENVFGRYRYVEIGLKDVPEGQAVAFMDYKEMPDGNDPDFIVSYGTPLKYYQKVPVDKMDEAVEVAGDRSETAEESEKRVGHQALDMMTAKGESGVTAMRNREDLQHYRYAEVILSEIPEGYPVELMEYKDAPGTKDPEYIVSAGDPRKYYRKFVIEEMTVKSDLPDDRYGGSGDVGIVEKESRMMPEVGKGTGVYHYVEIDLGEIPEGQSVVVGEYSEYPDEAAPEYIVSIGTTSKYYRKVAGSSFVQEDRSAVLVAISETKQERKMSGDDEEAGSMAVDAEGVTGEGKDDESQSEEPGGDLLETRSVWEIRDFESVIPSERIPVTDAGLVLLHPFIGRMMSNLGLVKNRAFVSPLARIRAVHLLRDLTGSKEPHHNHNLILEKILCSLPVGYILPPEWKPTEKEKEETEALLQAVCDYWKPLSKSSTSALCGSFLHRPGAIERFQDTWTIRVEGRTIDILLDDLPWEISIIYLPWLEKPLSVEWQRE